METNRKLFKNSSNVEIIYLEDIKINKDNIMENDLSQI